MRPLWLKRKRAGMELDAENKAFAAMSVVRVHRAVAANIKAQIKQIDAALDTSAALGEQGEFGAVVEGVDGQGQ